MKKLISLIFAVAMMFVLAISASAVDVDTDDEFNKYVHETQETRIKLTSDIYSPITPNGSKEIDLNGHVLNVAGVETYKAKILVFKNGIIQGEGFNYPLNLTTAKSIVFDNVTIKNAVIQCNTGSTIFNKVTFDESLCFTYDVYRICYDSNKTKEFVSKKYSHTGVGIVNTNGGSFGLDNSGNLTVTFGNLKIYKIMSDDRERDTIDQALHDTLSKTLDILWKNEDNITLKQGEGKETLSIPVIPGTLHPESIPMPTVEKAGCCFDGWYDSEGNKLTKDSVITTAATYDIKWVPEEDVLPNASKALLELGFSQSRVNQILSLFGSKNLAGSAFIPIPYYGSTFNGPQATITTALVIAAIGIAASIYCVKGNKKDN